MLAFVARTPFAARDNAVIVQPTIAVTGFAIAVARFASPTPARYVISVWIALLSLKIVHVVTKTQGRSDWAQARL